MMFVWMIFALDYFEVCINLGEVKFVANHVFFASILIGSLGKLFSWKKDWMQNLIRACILFFGHFWQSLLINDVYALGGKREDCKRLKFWQIRRFQSFQAYRITWRYQLERIYYQVLTKYHWKTKENDLWLENIGKKFSRSKIQILI